MTTLNSIQHRAYSNAQQVAGFLNKNKRIYTTVAPFCTTCTSFRQHLAQVSAELSKKEMKGTSLTIKKKELKKSIAREAANICSLATAYAIDTNNKRLKYYVNHTYTDFFAIKDIVLQANITIIVQKITPYLKREDFREYGITANQLASLQKKAEQFQRSIGNAKMINFQSHYASRSITAILKKIKGDIAQFNRLLILFNEQHPGFVTGFQQACANKKTGASQNAIEGIVKDNSTGLPIENATITAEGKNKTAITHASGFYRLAGIKTGIHTITITAEGYTTQVIRVKIIRGKTTALAVILEAKFVSLPQAAIA